MTPESFSTDGHWFLIPRFDLRTVRGRCAVSSLDMRPGDYGVFRSHGLFDEFEGHYDISQYAIEQAARMIGYRSPEEVEALKDQVADLEVRLAAAQAAAFKKAGDAVKMAAARAAKADV
jgi:hypothetical protein